MKFSYRTFPEILHKVLYYGEIHTRDIYVSEESGEAEWEVTLCGLGDSCLRKIIDGTPIRVIL